MGKEVEGSKFSHIARYKYQVSEEQAIIDTIKREIIEQVNKMPDGKVINFEELMGGIVQSRGIKRNSKAEKQIIYEVKRMLKARRKISCLKDGEYVKDEYGIIADQEVANIKMEEAIQIGERIKKEIEAEGEKPTKEEILKRLAEDFKANQLYRTSIIVSCSNGTLLEKEDDEEDLDDLDR